MKFKKVIVFCTVILTGIIIGLLYSLFISSHLYIQGTSMEPTIHNGQRIRIDKIHYGIVQPFGDRLIVQWRFPQVDDIVIYKIDGRTVIKRCVATAGTHLEYSTDSGYTLIVGEKKYPLTEIQYHHMFKSGIVPENTIMCIGDNWETSIDSRNYGFIPTDRVIGIAECR